MTQRITILALICLVNSGYSTINDSERKVRLQDITEEELIAIRDGYSERVANAFKAEKGEPLVRGKIYPPLGPDRGNFVRMYSYSLVEYATRCMWLNESIDSANAALIENANHYLKYIKDVHDRDSFHWHSEMLLRLIELFGRNGTMHAGLLWKETESKIMEMVWRYCRSYWITDADYKTSKTWYVHESENHHAQHFTTLWHYAKLAKDMTDFADRTYDDGTKAREHYHAWNEYAKEYLTERAKKGMFIEMMSVGYNTVLLKGIFNFYDFAEDPELKRRTGLFLDLYFAYWGQEQIDGIAGGGKARIYDEPLISPTRPGLGYFFFGIGDCPGIQSRLLTAMTTTYRPPLVVVDIVCDVSGRGVYEVIQHPMGLAENGYYGSPHYRLRTDSGGILRYSYCTPDFIMGTTMTEARPYTDWTMISVQNREHGIIFEGHPAARIIPRCEIEGGTATFNQQWSVQQKGTMICQKLKTSRTTGGMRVWFAGDGLSTPLEENGWVFTEAEGAYAAVRVVSGVTRWDSSNEGTILPPAGPRVTPLPDVHGKWLYCEDEFTPVILEVARKSEYGSYQEFRDKMARQSIVMQGLHISYTGIYGDEFTFNTDYSRVPEINGVPVQYGPGKAFNSPFLQGDWNSGVVIIQKGDRKKILDYTDQSATISEKQNLLGDSGNF